MKTKENALIDKIYKKHADEDSFNYRAAMKEYAELKVNASRVNKSPTYQDAREAAIKYAEDQCKALDKSDTMRDYARKDFLAGYEFAIGIEVNTGGKI